MRRQAFIALWLAAVVAGFGAGSAFANSLAPTVRPRMSIPTPVQALRTVDVNVKPHLQTLDVRPRCEAEQKLIKRGTAVRDRVCEFE
ncbi:MAG: hypothetical protein A4S14_00965 [Proteobacteria bacterium SG_bin9]|nr:MAG: hypothetical protein A4S14_00965 [Proteobacteria bacterium SG_bin9]